MYRNSLFSNKSRFVSHLDTTPHPLKEDVPPLSIGEMLRRSVSGIPLSIPKPKENLPLNGNFFTDKFDILDTALRLDTKILNERKQDLLKQKERDKADRIAFEEWKKQQVQSALTGAVDPLSSTAPTDTK